MVQQADAASQPSTEVHPEDRVHGLHRLQLAVSEAIWGAQARHQDRQRRGSYNGIGRDDDSISGRSCPGEDQL